MRKFVGGLLGVLLVTLMGCVTINVYFPEAAAQKAADHFIGTVLDEGEPAPAPAKPEPAAAPARKPEKPAAAVLDLLIPAAYADDAPDLRVRSATTETIRERMQDRFRHSLNGLLDSGAVGFTSNGLVIVRDAGSLPLSQRAQASATVADENRDRNALYREIAHVNGHPEWEAQIRAAFANGWIERAKAGWYYQAAAGAWKEK